MPLFDRTSEVCLSKYSGSNALVRAAGIRDWQRLCTSISVVTAITGMHSDRYQVVNAASWSPVVDTSGTAYRGSSGSIQSQQHACYHPNKSVFPSFRNYVLLNSTMFQHLAAFQTYNMTSFCQILKKINQTAMTSQNQNTGMEAAAQVSDARDSGQRSNTSSTSLICRTVYVSLSAICTARCCTLPRQTAVSTLDDWRQRA